MQQREKRDTNCIPAVFLLKQGLFVYKLTSVGIQYIHTDDYPVHAVIGMVHAFMHRSHPHRNNCCSLHNSLLAR